MRRFVPGLELCRLLYVDGVRPVLDRAHPGLAHAAARVGPGSEVLGLDTARSADHDWGPRLQVFLRADDVDRVGPDLTARLAVELPKQVLGWPTNFVPPGARVRTMAYTDGPLAHRVDVVAAGRWLAGALGFDASAGPPDLLDWLATPTQVLAEVTGGAVYHDGTGELTAARRWLAWYPDDVWRYVLAGQWSRIGEEEAFVGRAAEAGDDLGSRVVAARLVRDVMRLCLLLARTWPPYGKWLGAVFARVPATAPVRPWLRDALAADDAGARQEALCGAYEAVAAWQNATGLADPVDPGRRAFHDRPFPVLDAGRFAWALLDRVSDPAVAALPPYGAVDQYVDSTAAIGDHASRRALVAAALGSQRGTRSR